MTVTAAGSQARSPSPLPFYFLLAFALTWGWQIPLFTGAISVGWWTVLGPSAAGILMAGAIDGAPGIIRLLKRVVEWRAGVHWYAAALLLVPAVYVANVLLLPGGVAALLHVPLAPFAASFAAGMLPAGLSALFWEEIGWRGFALPHMQARFGPLGGSLLLGLLWGLWHLPLWAFNPSVLRSESAAWTGIVAAYGMYLCSVIAYSIFLAWVLNHARGSVLLAVLLHASINASIGTFHAYFPALFVPAVEMAMVVAAALIVVATRLRLGYGSSPDP